MVRARQVPSAAAELKAAAEQRGVAPQQLADLAAEPAQRGRYEFLRNTRRPRRRLAKTARRVQAEVSSGMHDALREGQEIAAEGQAHAVREAHRARRQTRQKAARARRHARRRQWWPWLLALAAAAVVAVAATVQTRRRQARQDTRAGQDMPNEAAAPGSHPGQSNPPGPEPPRA